MRAGDQSSDLPCDLPCDLAVVILNYNTCGLLRDCLVSVQPQRHNLRMCVVVVDNASTDGSAAMVRREFPNVHLIANTANVGYSAGNNVALHALGFDQHPPKAAGTASAVCAAPKSRYRRAAGRL